MERLEQIGFYTLSDARARSASASSRLQRCELLVTGRCNFRCPYCRSVGGPDLSVSAGNAVLDAWGDVRCARLSGGEPTLHPALVGWVTRAKANGVERVAISTNGSAVLALYGELLAAGVDDVSVSLDACCAEDGDRMAGRVRGAWDRVTTAIRWLSGRVYTTVGIVLTPDNQARAERTIALAHDLGVADIRVIPAAQGEAELPMLWIESDVTAAHPILAYRLAGLDSGEAVRGLRGSDSSRCHLALDDMAVIGGQHYPCIIYLREGGQPIGPVGSDMRRRRAGWVDAHDTHDDPICRRNCLDVCRDYNNAWERFHGRPQP